jgi:hypothetical protein
MDTFTELQQLADDLTELGESILADTRSRGVICFARYLT